jgi:hypothetical protein
MVGRLDEKRFNIIVICEKQILKKQNTSTLRYWHDLMTRQQQFFIRLSRRHYFFAIPIFKNTSLNNSARFCKQS